MAISSAVERSVGPSPYIVTSRVFATSQVKFVPAAEATGDEEEEIGGIYFNYNGLRLHYPTKVPWITRPRSVNWKPASPGITFGSVGCGLENRRNACFLNSTLQALSYCPPIYQGAAGKHHEQGCRKNHLGEYCGFCQFYDHVRLCTTSKQSTSRKVLFYHILRKELLSQHSISVHEQQCAHEFLMVFLDWLARYEMPPRVVSESLPVGGLATTYLGQLFYSIIENRKICQTCGNLSKNLDSVNDFALGLHSDQNVDLNRLLQSYFAKELLEGPNKIFCDACKSNQPKVWSKSILVPPNILSFTLKRAGYDMRLKKSHRRVSIPMKIDMKAFVTSPGYDKLDHNYELCSAIVHHGGSTSSGHYVAYCRAPDNHFYCFNDEFVTPIKQESLESELSKAYILFYSRCAGPVPLPSSSDIASDYSTAKVIALAGRNPTGNDTTLSLFVGIRHHVSSSSGSTADDVSTQAPSSQHGGDFSSDNSPTFSQAASSVTSLGHSSARRRRVKSLWRLTLSKLDRIRSLARSTRNHRRKKRSDSSASVEVTLSTTPPSATDSESESELKNFSEKIHLPMPQPIWDEDEDGVIVDIRLAKNLSHAASASQPLVSGNKRKIDDLLYDQGRKKKKNKFGSTTFARHKQSDFNLASHILSNESKRRFGTHHH